MSCIRYVIVDAVLYCGFDDFLSQLAHALVEHETLDSDEVKKVIKGEAIRSVAEVLKEDLSKKEKEKEGSS